MDVIAKTDAAVGVAGVLADHKGIDPVVLDVSKQSSWTELFVICSAESQGHQKGLVKFVRNFLHENNVEIVHGQKKISEEGWVLIDCGYMVIHIMSAEAREFYDLERLWHHGEKLFPV